MSAARRALPAPRYDLAVVVLAYLAALGAAAYVGRTVHDMHPLVVAAAADLAATVVVFTFSVAYDNSSMYDAYWSVVPPALGAVISRLLEREPEKRFASARELAEALALVQPGA